MPSDLFGTETEAIADDLMRQLPLECRDLLGSDPADHAALLAELTREGVDGCPGPSAHRNPGRLMRLARLDLTRYGKFTGGSLDFGEKRPGRPDLHIVYGPNEAGKSTAFSAFLDLLFGIETQSEYAFLHPYKTMKIEAALELGGAAPKVFGRIKRPQNSLLDAADQPVGDAMLLGGFGGLDRAAYRNMFSLDDDTLEKGGQTILASKGDLGQLLFSASAGLAELSQTLEELRGQADRFHRGRSKSELGELKAQLDRLKGEREQLDTVLPTYRKLVETCETSRLRYEAEMAERAALQVRSHAVERLLQALPRYARLLALRERLDPLSGLPHPPSNWRDELPGLQREAIELATQLSGVRGRDREAEGGARRRPARRAGSAYRRTDR